MCDFNFNLAMRFKTFVCRINIDFIWSIFELPLSEFRESGIKIMIVTGLFCLSFGLSISEHLEENKSYNVYKTITCGPFRRLAGNKSTLYRSSLSRSSRTPLSGALGRQRKAVEISPLDRKCGTSSPISISRGYQTRGLANSRLKLYIYLTPLSRDKGKFMG